MMMKGELRDRILFYIFSCIFVLVIGFPFFWQLVSSIKLERDIFTLRWFPSVPTLLNYERAFTSQPLAGFLGNSAIISIAATLLSLALGSMGAYALARTPIRGKNALMLLVLSVSLLPPIVIVNPIFRIIQKMGLLNSHGGLIITNTLFTLTTAIWFLTPYMRSIPSDLEDAAEIDGAGPFTCFRKIILPLLGPGVFTVGILVFIQVWNEYLFALVMNPVKVKTVTVGLKLYESENYIPWGTIMAASVVIVIPLISMVLVLQKKIISGLMDGGLKE
jgi:multiple sugar transport system permease protein